MATERLRQEVDEKPMAAWIRASRGDIGSLSSSRISAVLYDGRMDRRGKQCGGCAEDGGDCCDDSPQRRWPHVHGRPLVLRRPVEGRRRRV